MSAYVFPLDMRVSSGNWYKSAFELPISKVEALEMVNKMEALQDAGY